MAEATISCRPFTPEEEGRNEDDQDLEEDDDDREELADDEKDRDTTAPTTPEPPTEVSPTSSFSTCTLLPLPPSPLRKIVLILKMHPLTLIV